MILATKIKECATCAYFTRDPSTATAAQNLRAQPAGFCLRYPPITYVIGTPQGPACMSVKTSVQPDGVCGEYAP